MLDALRRRLERLEGEGARPWTFVRIGPHEASVTYHGDSRGGPHPMAAAEARSLVARLEAEGARVLVFERRIVDPVGVPAPGIH